ncbi:MAG: 50S ribosomal protein L24 [bacterium]
MKIRLKDKVLIISGRDKGKTGEIIAVLPRESKVVVEGINISKKHRKPTTQDPKGGIVEIIKPIDASKVMIIDPKTNKPARASWTLTKDGKKERVLKVAAFSNKVKKASKASVVEKTAEPAKGKLKKEAKS